MVIEMNSIIIKGIEEFNDKNYDKALEYFDKVELDETRDLNALIYKIVCLIYLGKFDDALSVINSLIGIHPYNDFLWLEKVHCHISLNESEKAFKALKEAERLTDCDDKVNLMAISSFYFQLGNPEKSLELCDKVLEIDENCDDAIFLKARIAMSLKDDELLNELADYLLKIKKGNDIVSLMPIFLFKLFSKNYDDCLSIVEKIHDDDGKIKGMLNSVIFKQMCQDNDVNLLLDEEVRIEIGEAVSLMREYLKSGVDSGEIHGVHYVII